MRLVALFPRSWRQRYGEEFEVLLEETNLSPSDLLDLVRAAWDAHVHPQPHLSSGGEEMSVRLTRALWSAATAVAALIVLVLLANIPSPWTPPGLNPGVFGSGVTATIFGAAAAGLWRWGRMRPLWVLLALLAVRNLVQLLVVLLLTWSDGVLRPLYWNLNPTGYGWLPGTLVQLAAGIALVVMLARFLRLRLVTAVVIGLTLELLVGPSDLSLVRFLMLHGLDQILTFASPLVQDPRPGTAGQLRTGVLNPASYVLLAGSVVWALVLQQIALRPPDGGAPQPLAGAYLSFTRAHWAPLATLAVVVVLARFPLSAYLTSDAALNPAHFVPSGTDVLTQYRDCLKAYGVAMPAGANTKTASIPNGTGQRCANIINTYSSRVQGRSLPVPAPVTVGGLTYTVTSIHVAGSLLKIDWKASGRPIDDFAAAAYPAQPPDTTLSPTDPRSPGYRFAQLQQQYLQTSVTDSTGSPLQRGGGGGGLPRTKPYAWHEQTNALIPGAGDYTLQFGCDAPPRPPNSKGPAGGGCSGRPLATITITVS